jgi:hypothetical protein
VGTGISATLSLGARRLKLRGLVWRVAGSAYKGKTYAILETIMCSITQVKEEMAKKS